MPIPEAGLILENFRAILLSNIIVFGLKVCSLNKSLVFQFSVDNIAFEKKHCHIEQRG